MAGLRHDGFGVELNTLDVHTFVAKPHDFIVLVIAIGPGRDFQAVWQSGL